LQSKQEVDIAPDIIREIAEKWDMPLENISAEQHFDQNMPPNLDYVLSIAHLRWKANRIEVQMTSYEKWRTI
jgi:hypothetical protein